MYESILITGGAGFVGSSLALRLKRELPETQITALDNLHRRGSELHLRRLRAAGIEFVHGDIRSPEDLASLRPGLIIECSAEPSAQAGYSGSPEYLVNTNLVGCFHCLELARRVKADFLFLSTSRVYPVARLNGLAFHENETRFVLSDTQSTAGASSHGISEDFPLDGARSLYGMTKLASELILTEYADAYGVHCVINRCGLIAGPWQMGKTDQGVVTLWLAAHYFKRELNYIGYGGTGKQLRDILHIEDLCDLLIDQVLHFKKYQGRLFNVGGGLDYSLSLLEMTSICQEITGHRIRLGSITQSRPADLRIYISDHRQLTNFYGWRPRRNPDKVLADIFTWLQSEEPALKGIL